MVKNVRNKIIISVASILLMAAAIVVYPYIENLVKAAAGTPQGDGLTYILNGTSMGVAKRFRVEFDTLDFTYNGQKQEPKITNVLMENTSTGEFEPLNANNFRVESVSDSTNATTYTTTIKFVGADGSDYKITDSFDYNINPATLEIKYVTTQKVIKYDGSNYVSTSSNPIVKEVKAKMGSSELSLTPDMYTYLVNPTSGDTGDCSVTVTLKADPQNNYILHASKYQTTVTGLIAAYDLSDLSGISGTPYSVEYDYNNSTGPIYSDDSGRTAYATYNNGTAITPVLKIYKSGTAGTSTDLKLTSRYNGSTVAKIANAGTYDVSLVPQDSIYDTSTGKEYYYAKVSFSGVDEYFAGEYGTTFKVKGLPVDTYLKVYYDKDGDTLADVISDYDVVLKYNNGSPVKFEPAYVRDDTNNRTLTKNVDYTWECDGANNLTGTGVATLYITPKGSAAQMYEGVLEVKYIIAGDMNLADGYQFNGASPEDSVPAADGEVKLVYNGNVRYILDGYKVPSGASYLDTSYYELRYQYQDENGDWLPAAGWTQTEIKSLSGTDAEKMAESGLKRVWIKGLARYAGHNGYLMYRISSVTMDDSQPGGSADGTFSVSLSPSGSFKYDGKAKTPSAIVKFKANKSATEMTLVEGTHYTLSYENNINASNNGAKVIINGAGQIFSGHLEKTFTIEALAGNSPEFVDSTYATLSPASTYEYTGSPITPYLKVTDSGTTINLKESVDYTISFTDSNAGIYGTGLGYPSEPGTYTVVVNYLNPNIKDGPTTHYYIAKKKLDASMFKVEGTDASGNIVWDGTAMEPAVVPVAGQLITIDDYDVSYSYTNGTKYVGPVTATIKAKAGSNYTGSVTKTFTITPRPLNATGIETSITTTPKAAGACDVDITLRDTVANKNLTYGTDFDVVVKKVDDNTTEAHTHTSANIIEVSNAGKFYLVITGHSGSQYTGTLGERLEFTSGIDLSDYYAYIRNTSNRTMSFVDGGHIEIDSSKVSIYRVSDNSDRSSDFTDVWDLFLEGDTDRLGRVYVYAVPKAGATGYFGKTKKMLVGSSPMEGTYYDIIPAKWVRNDNKHIIVEINTGGGIVYDPQRDDLPTVEVYYVSSGSGIKSEGVKLEKGVDYDLLVQNGESWRSVDSLTSSLERKQYLIPRTVRFKIKGIGNYGHADNEYNLASYTVEKAKITEDWVIKSTNIPYLSTDRGFTVIYGKTSGVELEAGKDFILTGPEDNLGTNKRKYTISTKPDSYYIVDKDNKGSLDPIPVEINITATNLAGLVLKNSWADASEGELYVVWNEQSLMLTDHFHAEGERAKATPTFSINYLIKKGSKETESVIRPLVQGTDYTLLEAEYGDNKTVGPNQAANFVKIQGTGGFSTDKVTIPCTLYYPLYNNEATDNQIQFTKTKGNIFPGATITDAEFRTLSLDEIAAKVVMNYDDGTRDSLAPDGGGLNMTSGTDFTVKLKTAQAGIGEKVIAIVGTGEAHNYFKGSFDISFRTTGDLSSARIQVGSKTNNEVEYDSRYTHAANGTPQSATQGGLAIKVILGGVQLREGTHYKVTGISHPDGLGEGTVNIEGIGEYAGTEVVGYYKVVATLDSNTALKFEIYTNANTFENYAGINTSKIEYPYRNGDSDAPGVRPQVRLALMNYNGTDEIEDYSNKYYTTTDTTPEGAYCVTYTNNTAAGSAKVNLIASGLDTSYLRGSKSLDFTIKRSSLDVTSNPAIKIEYNRSVKYTGRPVDATALELVVKDMNCEGDKQTLTYGRDYTLEFETLQRTDVQAAPIRAYVKAASAGSYTDRTPIEFNIIPWDITDGADPMIPHDVEVAYTGSEYTRDDIGARVAIEQGGDYIRSLEYGKDYEITNFHNSAGSILPVNTLPKDAGNYTFDIVGKGNYLGTRALTLVIKELDLSGTIVQFLESDDHICVPDSAGLLHCVYNGHEHKPNVKVTIYPKPDTPVELNYGVDYTVEYQDNINAGRATVKINVTGATGNNFTGTKYAYFTIAPKKIDDESMRGQYIGIEPVGPVGLESDSLEGRRYDFTGNAVLPGIDMDKTLYITDTERSDAVLVRRNITDIGSVADYTITYITPNSMDEINDGKPECSYAGKITMVITGEGNYTGTKNYTYYIGYCIDNAVPRLDGIRSTEYNGLIQVPNVVGIDMQGLTFNDDEYSIVAYKNIVEDTNKLEITDICDAGRYYITVAGIPSKGTYTDNPSSKTVYTITQRSIAGAEVSGFEGMYYYTGSEIRPRGIIVTDTSLPVSVANPSLTKSVQLVGGEENGKDYTIRYSNNIVAGKATIIIKGEGNYKGYVYAYFTIDSSNISGGDGYDETSDGTGALNGGGYSISPSDVAFSYDTTGNNFMSYTGYSVRPTFTITCNGEAVPSSYFYVTLENSVNPGVATMVINGDGINLTGSIRKQYMIKGDLSRYGKLAPIEDQIYTGNQITPAVTVSVGEVLLREGVDYNVTYVNNTNMGKATAYATAVLSNNTFYYGRLTGTFNISNAAGGMQVVGYASTYSYTGSPITPDVAVTMNGVNLVKDKDYTVSYKNNTNVGMATIEVRGIGSYSGTKTITFNIQPKNIENCVASVVQNQAYTGQTYTPVISVTDMGTGKTLVSGSDYTLTYSNNTNPGTATITIQALGQNYTGTKVVNFKITSAPVTGLKFVSGTSHKVKIGWDKQDYADGYQICNASNRVLGATKNNSITISGLSSAKTYSFKIRSYVSNADGSVSYGDFSSILSTKTLLNTPAIKVNARGQGVVTVRWSKVEKASGYEIYYSTKKAGTYYKLANVSKSAKRIFNDKGLAKGEVYYYTVRAYRTINGEKVYSGYSTITKVKVK